MEKELMRLEREKEDGIQDLQRKLEEKTAQLQRLSAETEKAESELQERQAREASVDQELAMITNTISGILDRVGGPGVSSRVTDPIEQLDVIGQMHRFFTAAGKSDEDQQEEPSKKCL